MDQYHEKVNQAYAKNAKTTKKSFQRGEQPLAENSDLMSKKDDNLFCIKAVLGASLRSVDQCLWVTLCKSLAEICPAF